MPEEIKKRLNSWHSCCHLGQNLLFYWGVKLYVSPSVKNIVLRVNENRNLRNTFGSKTVDVTGGWRKLHNEKFRDL